MAFYVANGSLAIGGRIFSPGKKLTPAILAKLPERNFKAFIQARRIVEHVENPDYVLQTGKLKIFTETFHAGETIAAEMWRRLPAFSRRVLVNSGRVVEVAAKVEVA